MADVTSFKAETRERTGKGGARALRREGKIPAIVYGGGLEATKVAVPAKDLKREISTNPRFFASVVQLELNGKLLHVLPRDAQLHPVSEMPLHIDFVRAEGGTLVTVAVQIRFVNEPASPGLKRGGVLNIVRRDVELVCPANAIPPALVVDLTGFDIGESIHISSVKLPEGARPTITDRDFTLASIVPPTVSTEVTEAAEEVEAAAPAT